MSVSKPSPVLVRPSTMEEVPALNQLIQESARVLSRGFYSEVETEAAIQYVFGVDTALVKEIGRAHV